MVVTLSDPMHDYKCGVRFNILPLVFFGYWMYWHWLAKKVTSSSELPLLSF